MFGAVVVAHPTLPGAVAASRRGSPGAAGGGGGVTTDETTPTVPGLYDENDEPKRPKGQLAIGPLKVIMKVFFAARFARPDLIRACTHLALYVTKWDHRCDQTFHRLMCYIHSTLGWRMIGWSGDELEDVQPHLFADADFAGCAVSSRSTSGSGTLDVFPDCHAVEAAGVRVALYPGGRNRGGRLRPTNDGSPGSRPMPGGPSRTACVVLP